VQEKYVVKANRKRKNFSFQEGGYVILRIEKHQLERVWKNSVQLNLHLDTMALLRSRAYNKELLQEIE